MAKNEKGRSFLLRLLSGTVLFIVVVAAILLSRYAFVAILGLICVGAMLELFRIGNAHGAHPQKILGITTGLLMIAAAFLFTMPNKNFITQDIAILLSIAILLLFFAVFIAELFRKRENPLLNIAVTLLSLIYIALPLSMMCYIAIGGVPSLLSQPAPYQPWTVLCYIFVIWANDIGAYLIGMPFGRHKMFPRLSPKKSWEGFAGGIVAGVGIAVLCGWLMGQSIVFWVGLGFVAVVFGVLGDLVESMIKRSAAVKDSGSVMPGHGGVLDRFDSLLIATPFVLVYFIIFTLV